MSYLDYLNTVLKEDKKVKKPKEKIVIKLKKEESKEIVENKIVKSKRKGNNTVNRASYILEGVHDFKPKKVSTERIPAKDISKKELKSSILHAGHLL